MPLPFNRQNFHRHTFCIWQERPLSDIDGRLPQHSSRTGSQYYFNEEGVYRLSGHWARVANCRWRLEGKEGKGTRLGYARWTDFLPNNDTERLYWIEVDFERKEASYRHRDQGEVKGLLRTAADTIRRMREVRKILHTDDWAAYVNGDAEIVRKQWIQELVETDRPLVHIRTAESKPS